MEAQEEEAPGEAEIYLYPKKWIQPRAPPDHHKVQTKIINILRSGKNAEINGPGKENKDKCNEQSRKVKTSLHDRLTALPPLKHNYFMISTYVAAEGVARPSWSSRMTRAARSATSLGTYASRRCQ